MAARVDVKWKCVDFSNPFLYNKQYINYGGLIIIAVNYSNMQAQIDTKEFIYC